MIDLANNQVRLRLLSRGARATARRALIPPNVRQIIDKTPAWCATLPSPPLEELYIVGKAGDAIETADGLPSTANEVDDAHSFPIPSEMRVRIGQMRLFTEFG